MDDDHRSPLAPPPPPPQTTHPELSYTTIPLNTPATEIRLFELFPSADFSSPLQCRLYNTSISSPTPFKALSYAWGSDDKTHLIYIDASNATSDNGNDADADTSLANLTSGVSVSSDDEVDGDTCLRHLRAIYHRDHPSTILTLWIDQICIDQPDSDEKVVQVGLMKQIYSRAEQVLIWLGPAADGSDEVMDALAELGSSVPTPMVYARVGRAGGVPV
ncbi:hypothetical protein N0V85_008359 [Neurospora sp. IMI 360204]|nr:hypothetical protein N0V85_008359 [Neurospora sp. IMI 360204]